MRPKSLVLLLLALGCGLVASIGINQVLASRRHHPTVAKGPTEPIFVAIADIDTWEPLSVQNVKLEEWPSDRIPAGAVRKLEELDGRRVRTKIYQGEPILEAKLLSPGASAQGATGLIPKGFRAVSVRVDSVSGGSSLILPNDRVDVLVHIQANPSRGLSQTITRTILQDVQVFAVNDVFRREPQETEESAIAAKTITLLVTPEDAELLTLATEMGKIRLVMRSPEDDLAAVTEGAVAQQLLNEESRKGNRDEENLMKDADEPASKDDLISFLNDQQASPPPADAAATPASTEPLWRMIVLLGAQATEFEFSKDSRLPRAVEVGSAGPAPAATPVQGADTAAEPTTDPQPSPTPDDSTLPIDLPHDWDATFDYDQDN